MKIKETIVGVWRRKMNDGQVELYFDYTHRGKRVRKSSKIRLTGGRSRTDKRRDEECMLLFEDKRRELQRALNGNAIDASEGGEIILWDYFEEVIENKTPNTRLSWKKAVKRIREYESDNQITLGEIDRDWVIGLKRYLQESDLGQNTASLYYDKLCALMNNAVADGLLERNPTTGVKGIAKLQSNKCYLTMEEVRRIDQLESRFDSTKRAFVFSCMTGLRISDVLALTWRSIKENNNGRLYIDFNQIKTGECASVVLNDLAMKQLGERGEDHESVFCQPTRMTISYRLNCIMQEAGITKHVTFHVGRHTAATLLLEADADIYTVSNILGHRSIAATQIYAKVVDKKKEEALDRLNDLMK